VPPISVTLPAASALSPPPRAPSAPATQTVSSTGTGSGGGLAKTTDADIFDQLSRLSQLRVQNPAPANAPKPAVAPSPSAPSPLSVGVGYNHGQGLGVGPSPSPLGQQHLQAQPTGLFLPPAQGGPRGPFAPVPANQGLLAPLVPTATGFNGFVPTRPATSPSFLGTQPTGISPLALQPTGFQPSLAPQPTGFQPPFAPQPTGFQPSFVSQPTGFQPSLAPQPTGFQPSLAPQPTGFGGGSPFGGNPGGGVPPVPPLPSSFQNGSFSQLQPRQCCSFFVSSSRPSIWSCHCPYAETPVFLCQSPLDSTPALDNRRSATASRPRYRRCRKGWARRPRKRTRTRQTCLRL
jgi:hypothetical protein